MVVVVHRPCSWPGSACGPPACVLGVSFFEHVTVRRSGTRKALVDTELLTKGMIALQGPTAQHAIRLYRGQVFLSRELS